MMESLSQLAFKMFKLSVKVKYHISVFEQGDSLLPHNPVLKGLNGKSFSKHCGKMQKWW